MFRFVLVLSFCFATFFPLNAGGDSDIYDMDALISELMEYVNADSIQSYMLSLENFGTRFALADNNREVAVWIKNKFKSFGYNEVRLDSFFFTWSDSWQYNVECTYTGHTYPERVYIMGAHHDAISSASYSNFNAPAPGADDNASGVAAALEVARVLKNKNYIPESTIKFVTFAAEELGLHGAHHYASKAKENNIDIVMMLNNDMISYATGSEDDWKVKLIKYDNSDEVTNLARNIVNKFTKLDYEESTLYANASDSYAFYVNGYMAIFFHEDEFTPHYHRATDIVENTNKHYAAEITRISLGMLIHENGPGFPLSVAEPTTRDHGFYAFPNPFGQSTIINYEVLRSGNVSLSIYDIFGRKACDVINKWHEPGNYNIDWYGYNLSAGVYFCYLKTPYKNKTLKLFKSY